MKYSIIALLFSSAEAINIRTHGAPAEPEVNTCVNVRKDSAIEEPCETAGNSAWVPDVPLLSPEEMGFEEGWNGRYYWMSKAATEDGYNTAVLKPSADVVAQEINFANSQFNAIAEGFPSDHFQAEWSGMLKIEEGGLFTFQTGSDDGSRLWINNVMVVDNWGRHGTKYVEGTAKLIKGYHEIKVHMFEDGGGATAYANWHGEGTDFTPIHVYHAALTE